MNTHQPRRLDVKLQIIRYLNPVSTSRAASA